MGLRRYRDRRDFRRTPEPRGRAASRHRRPLRYAVQKHDARRLHHDLRLELDGVLKSWAVPRTPPLRPGDKVLAVQTEDHPIDYAGFEGVIPKGQYGGGTVMLWDRGTWEADGDARADLERGKLTFRVEGERLRGRWSLVKMRPRERDGRERRSTGREWLLIKRSDDEPRALGWEQPERSVASGRTMEEIAEEADRVWMSEGEGESESESESESELRQSLTKAARARGRARRR